MNDLRLVRSELRKLTTTKLLWGFLAATAVLAAFVLVGIVVGAQAGAPGEFLADDPAVQRDVVAFGTNALLLGGLFGAVAAAREYSHGTVVPMFLVAPQRHRAMLAKFTAAALAGAVLGALGGALSLAAGAIAFPIVDLELLLTGGGMARLVAGSVLAGAVGAVLGIGIGALLRNTGGAVTVIVLLLLIAPPILAQLVTEAARWIPNALVGVVSGAASDPGLGAAIAALLLWGLVPAGAALAVVRQRDVI